MLSVSALRRSRPFAGLLALVALTLAALAVPAARAQSTAEGLIEAGVFHTCALATSGNVTCWGNNDEGQTTVPAGLVATSVSASVFRTCALTTSGSVSCWGRSSEGQTSVPAGLVATSVSVGEYHTCAVTTGGSVSCWGRNNNDQTTAPATPLAYALRAPGQATPDLTLDFTAGSGTVPTVSASVRPGQAFTAAAAPLRRLWTVTPTGGTPGWSARVRLYYAETELPDGADEATLTLGKIGEAAGATWQAVPIVARNTADNWVEADVTSFSTFMLVAAGTNLPVEVSVEIGGGSALTLVALGDGRGGVRAVRALVGTDVAVEASLFDVTGRRVAVLFSGSASGEVEMALPSSLASGVYVVRVAAGTASASRTVVVR